MTDLLENKDITIDRLRKLLFGSGSEKTREVLNDAGCGRIDCARTADDRRQTADPEQEPAPRPRATAATGPTITRGGEDPGTPRLPALG